MKIIFFGTPTFAALNLKNIINNGHEVIAVVTPPDSKKGRGKQVKVSAVKEVALKYNIPTLQPNKLRDKEFIDKLKYYDADLFIIVAFRMLPEIVWKQPKKGTINLHTSLLPNYRGAAPINRVLINGEKETGISTFFINENIDSGGIILQKKIKLDIFTTAAQLHNKLINYGNNMLEKTIKLIKNNEVLETPQKSSINDIGAPKLTKETLKIDWEKSADDIHNLVRGLSPYLNNKEILKEVSICPSAWFLLEEENKNTKRIKLHLTEVIKSDQTDLVSLKTDNKTYLHVITKKNTVAILNLQVEGKRTMSIQQFLQGNKITQFHRLL